MGNLVAPSIAEIVDIKGKINMFVGKAQEGKKEKSVLT